MDVNLNEELRNAYRLLYIPNWVHDSTSHIEPDVYAHYASEFATMIGLFRKPEEIFSKSASNHHETLPMLRIHPGKGTIDRSLGLRVAYLGFALLRLFAQYGCMARRGFTILALLLSVIGLHAVIAYSVSQQDAKLEFA